MTAVTTAPAHRPAKPGDGQRRHLRVVPEPRRQHTLRFACACVVVFGFTVFGAVTLNALAAGDAVRAHGLDARVVDAERRYADLVSEVARLEDPGRIRAAARELGMVPASSPQYLTVARALPADGAVAEAPAPGDTTDPIKPVLAVQK